MNLQAKLLTTTASDKAIHVHLQILEEEEEEEEEAEEEEEGEEDVSSLVRWCFKLSQPQRIVTGLRETFTNAKRYVVERTNKAEI